MDSTWPREELETLGEQLRDLRERAGMSMVEVSDQLDERVADLDRLENGRLRPGWEMVRRIAELYKPSRKEWRLLRESVDRAHEEVRADVGTRDVERPPPPPPVKKNPPPLGPDAQKLYDTMFGARVEGSDQRQLGTQNTSFPASSPPEPSSPPTPPANSAPQPRQLAENAKVPPMTSTALVFLCHSSGDKEQVRHLYRRLKADGFNCWFDEEDLLPGQDWDFEITHAIRRSKIFLACLSRASTTKSGYLQKEIKRALDVADEQPEGVAYIIPVRLEECDVPSHMERWQWVDLFKGDEYKRLVRGLRAGLNRSQPGSQSTMASNAENNIQAAADSPVVYSSNDFNVSVTTAIQQAWWDCFGERTHISAPRDYTKRPDGGVDGLIWPLDKPDVKVSFRTFPSPETTLRSAEANELLKDSDAPCLIFTRLPVKFWTREAIERSYPPPVRFLQWTGSDDDKDALETYLRILRDSVSQSP